MTTKKPTTRQRVSISQKNLNTINSILSSNPDRSFNSVVNELIEKGLKNDK